LKLSVGPNQAMLM